LKIIFEKPGKLLDKIEKILYNIIVKDKIILIFNKHNIFPLRAVSFLP
jgi:hypothetical protein